MNFTKEESDYLKGFDFKEGLPDGSTEKALLNLSIKNSQLENYIIPNNISNEEVLDAIRPTQFKKAEENNFGLKYDCNKPRFDLIPADALEEVAKVYTIGANKYGDRNWELGMSYGRLFGALMRHAWGWWKGERDDKENKLHHLSSVIFNALALLHYELNLEKFKEFDDRNLPQ